MFVFCQSVRVVSVFSYFIGFCSTFILHHSCKSLNPALIVYLTPDPATKREINTSISYRLLNFVVWIYVKKKPSISYISLVVLYINNVYSSLLSSYIYFSY